MLISEFRIQNVGWKEVLGIVFDFFARNCFIVWERLRDKGVCRSERFICEAIDLGTKRMK
jgi:hypothetical protein